MVHNYLYRFDRQSESGIPTWPPNYTQSKDGLSWTFTLRKGVKFHDGTPFNGRGGEVQNFDRFLGPEKPLKSGLHDPIIKSVEVVNEYNRQVST